MSIQTATVMSDPSIMSHMFISSFGAGKHENGASVLPLPLNLIALIISYVGSQCEQGPWSRMLISLHSSTVLQISLEPVAPAVFSII